MARTAPAALDRRSEERRGQVYVLLAAVAWSTAGVLQRQLDIDVPTQVSGRAVFAAVALLVFVAVAERGRFIAAWRSIGLAGIGVALGIAVASATFIAALEHTTVARVLFIQAASPVLAAVFARILIGEPIGRRTALAMTIALGGVALMLGAPGSSDLTGDALSIVMAIAFELTLVITRRRRDVSMAPATCLSQLFLIAAFAPFATPAAVDGGDAVALALLGAGQIGLGLALLMVGARLIPAAQVALISLLEVVLGPLWVWLAYTERPDAPTLVGGAIVIAAIVIQARGAPATERADPCPPP
jgi:drug/metabolite transporter (DMT)-like permease